MRGFSNDYERRLEILRERRMPQDLVEKFAANAKTYRMGPAPSYIHEVYDRLLTEGSAIRYAVGAMQPVDPKYTKLTFDEGDRVKNQLDSELNSKENSCEFDYQGSVTNDTHIKAHSDIDLLVITSEFTTLEPPQQPSCPYKGNAVQALKELRANCESKLDRAFPRADLDTNKSKAISISGGSLSRKIDVVIANWYNSNDYAHSSAKSDRGIQVLDKTNGSQVLNYPFRHNRLLDQKGDQTAGGLKKAIRLLKSLRYDATPELKISSYDIAALAYAMDAHELSVRPGFELQLIVRIKQFLDRVVIEPQLRDSLYVPNKTRKLFGGEGTSIGQVNELRTELDDLLDAIQKNLAKSFRKLGEARLQF